MSLKRVVVTGLGAVTPIGNDIRSYWEGLVSGKSGADFITYFDTSKFKTQFACELKGFDALNYFDRKEARKMDRFAQYAIVCSDEAIKDSGIDCELIDLQTLVPWDRDTVVNSVKKTGRCVIVHEAPKTSGYGAEMSASVQERCFYHLEAPIQRVTGWDTPFPHTTEWDYLPSPQRIAEAIKKTQEE